MFGFLSRSYWDNPAEENRSILQLFPIRLLFAGGSMVTLFLVISGYAISIPLLQAREATDSGNHEYLFRRLYSAATRRIFRIYLPVIALTTISQILFFLDIYQFQPPNDQWLGGLKPLSAPWSHFLFLVSRILHLLDVTYARLNLMVNRPDLHNFTMQLWTMPVEFRGSCIVYLLIMTLCSWRPQLRRMALLGTATYWFYIGQWDFFAFIMGLYLAEGHFLLTVGSGRAIELCDDTSPRPRSVLQLLRYNILCQNIMTERISITGLQVVISFLVGIYLLCLGQDQEFSAEYRFLAAIQSPAWEELETGPNCWRSVGAVLTIYAISQSAILRRPLESQPVQYLGRISFALYLVHLTIYFILKGPMRDLLWYSLTRVPFPGTIDAQQNNSTSFGVAWISSVVICGVIMVVVADLWTRFIDRNCLSLAKRVEEWVTK